MRRELPMSATDRLLAQMQEVRAGLAEVRLALGQERAFSQARTRWVDDLPMTAKDVAVILHWSAGSVHNAVSKGRLRRHSRVEAGFRRADVLAFMELYQIPMAAPPESAQLQGGENTAGSA